MRNKLFLTSGIAAALLAVPALAANVDHKSATAADPAMTSAQSDSAVTSDMSADTAATPNTAQSSSPAVPSTAQAATGSATASTTAANSGATGSVTANPGASKLAAGAMVKDTAGAPVGTIEKIDGQYAVLATKKNKVRLPLASFGASDTGPVIAMTEQQVDAAAAGANAPKP